MFQLRLCFCILYAHFYGKGALAIYGIPGISEFMYGGSRYTLVETVQNNVIITRRDAREFCESHGELLVSLTTADEAAAVKDFMSTHYPGDSIVIGLSREAGLDRYVDSNWLWETGEPLDTDVVEWGGSGGSQPSVANIDPAAVRLKGTMKDRAYDLALYSPYFMCERAISGFYIVGEEKLGVQNMTLYLRCAIRCRREYFCNGFYVDDAGCQIEMGKVNIQYSIKAERISRI
ncbi:uncharacterized protein [Antedon mediterranea]|uniref:uncharacterized protein n=1 Tax=Antedon mediterranea TaxID=105859 RepID=UPI003AF9BC1C